MAGLLVCANTTPEVPMVVKAVPSFTTPVPTAAKILWVRKNEPENYNRCRHILLPKDYIRYILTGVFATEVSDASGMQLLDVPGRCWSDEVLKALNKEDTADGHFQVLQTQHPD